MDKLILYSMCFFILISCTRDPIIPIGKIEFIPESGTRHTIFEFSSDKSYDLNNETYSLEYRWDFYDDGVWEYDFSPISSVNFKFDKSGLNIVILEIKDPQGNISRTSTSVLVSESNSNPIIILHAYPKTGSLSTDFLLDASQSYDNEESKIFLKFLWDLDSDGIIEYPYGNYSQIHHSYSTSGIKTIICQAKDSDGGQTESWAQVNVINTSNEYSFIIDHRDMERYNVVKIGNQWMMAENLRYGTYIANSLSPRNNDTCEIFAINDDPANIKKYGGLYFWAEILGYEYEGYSKDLCPIGWHLPAEEEWKQLENDLGAENLEVLNYSWNRLTGIGSKLMQNQSSGFEAQMYGYRDGSYSMTSLGEESRFWTRYYNDHRKQVLIRGLSNKSSGILRKYMKSNSALSVRCFKNRN